MQKFYLHDINCPVQGTLPGSTTLSATTPGATAAGAGINRYMDGLIYVGATQIQTTLTTLAQTSSQQNWHRRWISPPLAAQTITALGQTWTLSIAASQSSTNSNMTFSSSLACIWRPSTGVKVANLWDQVTLNTSSGPGASFTTEAAFAPSLPQTAGTNQTCQDGDVLVFELWGFNVQGMATAFTNSVYYNGTTEASATSIASYLLAPADLIMLNQQPQYGLIRSQALYRAAYT